MTFNDLILNETSRKHLQNYLKKPTQTLLLSGARGVGLGTIAKTLAQNLAKNNVKLVQPTIHKNQKTLNINSDDVREIVELNRSKRRAKFVIVIDEAEKLTGQAPQILLKILEEPTANLLFILASHFANGLPATILSRAQKIEILPPARADIAKLLEKSSRKLTVAQKNQIEFLAGNLPAEFARLLNDENYFRETAAAMETAKNFVAKPVIKRLEIVADVSGRENALALANNVAKILLLTAVREKNDEKFAKQLNLVASTVENLANNGNARAQLVNLAVNL